MLLLLTLIHALEEKMLLPFASIRLPKKAHRPVLILVLIAVLQLLILVALLLPIL